MTHLLSIGTATPRTRIPQDAAAAHAAAVLRAGCPERTVHALYRRAGVRSRGSVLGDERDLARFFPPDSPRGPTTAQRLQVFDREAGPLAAEAAADALAAAEIAAGRVTHLVTVSCTGSAAPGVDRDLIVRLGLASTVRRAHVGFMGCHAAINALDLARAIVAGDRGAVVLVCCVELCTLHFAYSTDPEKIVSNALFGDGAAAAVVAASDGGHPRLHPARSETIPDTESLMSWRIGDHGFEMGLSARVPEEIAAVASAWVDSVLASAGTRRDAVGGWALHPGGPRVLSSLRAALDLPPHADRASRGVLADHGNMSSATVLFILDALLRGGTARPMLAAAFGPGLACEAIVLT